MKTKKKARKRAPRQRVTTVEMTKETQFIIEAAERSTQLSRGVVLNAAIALGIAAAIKLSSDIADEIKWQRKR
jgi:hypothetical protein